jgi:hypothetical protein
MAPNHIARIFLIAIALMVGVWVGAIALAATLAGVGYGAPLLMGAAVGVLAGVFWGSWYAFVAYAEREERERGSHAS